jgi:hypothetical protein
MSSTLPAAGAAAEATGTVAGLLRGCAENGPAGSSPQETSE